VNYCGIDIGGVSSYVYVTDAGGRKRWSGPVATTKEALRNRLRRFLRGGLAVAIEAGNQTATVALARKLLVIAYHMLREETEYDARRLKRRAA